MGVSETYLEKNKLKLSRNDNNTSLLSVLNNYMVIVNGEKNKNEYKNLYYVEDITKKIFVLLYFHENKIKKKIKDDIKDIYNFKKYYLINSNWLKEYKDYFLYDTIAKKLKKYNNYTYNRIKAELNYISKIEIGQIQLYSDTKISNNLRDALKLKYENKKIESKIIDNDCKASFCPASVEEKFYNTPEEFELINEDIYELIIKEEFFYNMKEDIKNTLSFEVLLGNNQIIIRNKKIGEEENVYNYINNYLIYTKNQKPGNEQNNKYILKFILNYDKKDIFYNHYSTIIKEGLNNYIKQNKNVDLNQKNCEQKVLDNKKNVLANFINIGVNEDDFINTFNSNKINEVINLNEKSLIDSKSKNNNDLICIHQSIIDKNKKINNFIFTQLKATVYLLENILYNNNLDDNEKNKYQIDFLCPEEIIENIKNKKLKNIILINRNDLNNIKAIVNSDLIKNYLNSNEEEKYDLLLNNENEFSNIYKNLNDF
jgi:hypothetical protein